MSENNTRRIGLIIGREHDWPEAFITAVAERNEDIVVELAKLGGTYVDEENRYGVIIDRMSHEVPYYRTYVKYAAMRGSFVINNPYTWSADNRFFGTVVANRLGLRTPRTIVLPNKDVEAEVIPDSFRNLQYPMDWEGITAHVGVPAVLKEISSGGRRLSYHVHSVDELIQRYDESGTRTMILQQLIQGGQHIHCLVIGGSKTLLLPYDSEQEKYQTDLDLGPDVVAELEESARALTNVYGYDVNLVEFNSKDGELLVINSTNPAPIMDRKLMTPEQFDWAVQETVNLALERLENPPTQESPFRFQ